MSIAKRERILHRRLRAARAEVNRLRAELAELREPTEDASDAPSVAQLCALDPEAADVLALKAWGDGFAERLVGNLNQQVRKPSASAS